MLLIAIPLMVGMVFLFLLLWLEVGVGGLRCILGVRFVGRLFFDIPNLFSFSHVQNYYCG